MTPLWFDEILSLQRAQLPFWEHMRIQVSLWEIILRAFATPALIRIPAMVCILLSAWMLWRMTHNKVTVLVFALLPGVWWMFMDARYYAGLTALFIATLLFAKEKKSLGLYGLAGLSIYIHPIGPAYAIPALLWDVWQNKPSKKMLALYATLPLVWLVRLPWMFGDANLINTFWLDRADPIYLLEHVLLSLSVSPRTEIVAAVLILFLFIFARPPLWIIATPLIPIVTMHLTGLVIGTPLVFYRTIQPALVIGVPLAAGHLKRETTVILIALIATMQFFTDYSVHNGHLQNAVTIIRTEGGCVWADEFAHTSIALDHLPQCDRNAADWLLSIESQPLQPYWMSDGWHFPQIALYKVQP